MAPTSPDMTTTRCCGPLGASMIPLPIVCATPVPSSAPIRFMAAASSSAVRGVSARVETEVAIAFAAS